MKQDREQFRLFISDKNSIWINKGIFLEVLHWKNVINSMSEIRLQDRYNKAIKGCDIFVLLFDRKMGKYSEEEFDIAHKRFLKKKKPLVYTYFKDIEINVSEIDLKEMKSLKDFQNKIDDLGHFYTRYKSVEDLQTQFATQLDMLWEKGFFQNENTSKNQSKIKNSDLKTLLDEGEISQVFEILETKKITNKFLYNRLKKEFQAGGLTGLQLMDWNDRMRIFIRDL